METASRYKLVTKADYASVLRDYSRTPMNQSLSRAALETLSIIAYKQPITRVEVDDIRGVNSSGAITKLLSFDLIREDGKKKSSASQFVCHDGVFLDYMGINHLEELPKVEEVDIDPEEGQLFSERTEELDEN